MTYRIEVVYNDGGIDLYYSTEYPETTAQYLLIRPEADVDACLHLPLHNLRCWKAE